MIHVGMLLTFVSGAILSTYLCQYFLGKAIWFSLIPLIILFIQLLHADLIEEKGYLEMTPKGH